MKVEGGNAVRKQTWHCCVINKPWDTCRMRQPPSAASNTNMHGARSLARQSFKCVLATVLLILGGHATPAQVDFSTPGKVVPSLKFVRRLKLLSHKIYTDSTTTESTNTKVSPLLTLTGSTFIHAVVVNKASHFATFVKPLFEQANLHQ